MASNHGARQQKKVAKQKAKRAAKRSKLQMRTSIDPSIRLQSAGKWPVTSAVVSTNIWKSGLGSLAIARRESEGNLVFAVFLVDVYCLGVKDAFWIAGAQQDFNELIRRMEKTQKVTAIAPACLVKIVQGAVDYANSFGLPPHPDYRHAARLLEGIDPTTCPEQFTFGRNGKPFYVQGPHETSAQAMAIMQRVQAAGGHFIIEASDADIEGKFDPSDALHPDDFADDDDDDDREEEHKHEWR
jgi:hypothetical protein